MSHLSLKQRLRSLFMVLILAVQISAWVPAPQSQRWDGNLGIKVISASQGQTICRGSGARLRIRVFNAYDGKLDVSLGVSDAFIHITDNKGRSFEEVSDPWGDTWLQYPTDEEGEIIVTITAEKEFYTSAPPEKVYMHVRSCQWKVDVNFLEEYNLFEDGSAVIGGFLHWSGNLKAQESRGENQEAKVELVHGGGRFVLFASDTFKAPIHISLQDSVSGDFTAKVDGTLTNDTLKLNFDNDPVSYPPFVNIKITDYSDQNIQVKHNPAIPTGPGNGMVFYMMKTYDATFPASGGSLTISDAGYGVFFDLPDRKEYELNIRVKPASIADFVYQPGPSLVASTGR